MRDLLGVIDANGEKRVTSYDDEAGRAVAAAEAAETARAVWRVENDQVWKQMKKPPSY